MAVRKAIGYVNLKSRNARLSSARGQTIDIGRYCETANLRLVAILVDDNSSGHLDLDQRPAGEQLIGLARQHRAKNFIAYDLYTLFKDAVDAGRQVTKWEKKNIRLHLLNLDGYPFVNDGDAGWAFNRGIEVMGKMGRWNIRERIASSQAKRKVRGYVYGPVPYGYDRKGSLLMENRKEQSIIRRIMGMRKAGVSYRRIAEALNAEGVPTKKSGKWHGSTVHWIVGDGSRSPSGPDWDPSAPKTKAYRQPSASEMREGFVQSLKDTFNELT